MTEEEEYRNDVRRFLGAQTMAQAERAGAELLQKWAGKFETDLDVLEHQYSVRLHFDDLEDPDVNTAAYYKQFSDD